MKTKCHKCGKDVGLFFDSKKAIDNNYYCLDCFKDGNLKEKLNYISITSILLKILSIIYLFNILSSYNNMYYQGESTLELGKMSMVLILWALSIIVNKLCIISKYCQKKIEEEY